MQLDQKALLRQGIYATQMTPVQRLDALAAALRPVRTRFELARYGSDADGGYLLPEDLQGIAACFSPGVDVNASFEADLQRRAGIGSHLADYSVKRPPAGLTPRSFLKKYLGVVDDHKYTTLDTWVRQTDDFRTGRDLLLQMDIEGSEYACLMGATEETLRRFRIIVVEVHNLSCWGEPRFFDFVNATFSKLLRHFHVVHNHPNNNCPLVELGGFIGPQVFELTLLRKDRAEPLGFCESFPHPLDRLNIPAKPDVVLPAGWWGPDVPAPVLKAS